MNYAQEVPMYSKTFPNLLKHRMGMAMQWYLFFYLMMLIDSKQDESPLTLLCVPHNF